MTSGQDRYRQDWALDEEGRTRYESSPETYLGSRITGSPPSAIPRYTGNYNQHHTTNSSNTRFKATGSRGFWNQTNQAHNNFYQKSTRPTIEYWPETSQGFGTYERPSSVDQQYSGQYTCHKNTNQFSKYTMENLEALRAWTKEQGGIKDQKDYNDFIEDFNIILKYLIEDGQIIDEDEAGDLLLSLLSTQLRRFLLKRNQIHEDDGLWMCYKNPKQEETSIASDIGPKTYRTTTLIDNTYIEGKQGIQNQIVNKNKEEETSTNLAGPPDKHTNSINRSLSNLQNTQNYDQVNQLVFGNSQQITTTDKEFIRRQFKSSQEQEEETIYLAKDIESVMKDLPGYKLMDEDFGSILPSITADKFFYELWIEGREKVVENEIGQWIYFDGWVPGTGTQPGLSDSGSGNMDQSWEPIKEQVKLGSSVQTLEDLIDEENLEEKEESHYQLNYLQHQLKISQKSVPPLTQGKGDNIYPVKFRIWNQERKAPDPGEKEKENQLHSKAQHSGNNSHQGNQTTKKIIEEETVMKTSGGLNQQQKHFSIMTKYKSVLNKFKSVKQQTSQNPHSPLIKAPNVRNPFIGALTPNPPEPPDLEEDKNQYLTNRTNISTQKMTVLVLEEYEEDSSNLPLEA
ncbi:hypothetical protein PPACK8108_LOCUS9030 [Phakopsora pachyrhizi]|uniref:Uncharacterized protein n=1 Tax=Phakopsora pachyrhizi TaxID=170000 RepID=A0AAV0AY75_PHAPC|nr:hypothetical protein PPACK8108_LOCUS9030 [Phakopsora pachyrhizi]